MNSPKRNGASTQSPVPIAPATMPRLGTVDERFQSYNVEMVEVIGGRFWKPYGARTDAPPQTPSATSTPVGMDPALFEARTPIDLSNERLRALASALGPAYIRVSGTWANTVYFHDVDTPPPPRPPIGFSGVLTREQWRGVVEFAQAVNAEIVTSMATSAGARDAEGVWTPAQARKLFDYTTSVGGRIAATEFMNEPTAAMMGGAPPGYDAAAFGRDLAVFRSFLREASPDTLLLGPGSVGEGISLFGRMPMLRSEDLLTAASPVFAVFSYHFYGAVSERCAALMPNATTTAEAALSGEWLARTDTVEGYYIRLRDRFEPGQPLWITETGDAACGGNPWASTFLDTFRYLDQHGRLAKRGVQVIMHNTLASSDYGLLDQDTFAPRPNYWAALLWRRLMGATVLDADSSPAPSLHLYAHDLPGHPGGLTLLAINTSRTQPASIELPTPADRYTLSAPNLENVQIQLNGHELKLGGNNELPALQGSRIPSGRVELAPASISFLALPDAGNVDCR